jgi:hypothetical protein
VIRSRITRAARTLFYKSLNQLPMARRIDILRELAFSVRRDLARHIAAQTDGMVQAGIFSGSKLSIENLTQSERNFVPKICGSYEAELSEVLVSAASDKYSAIVNIGCADGFYAIGLARLNRKAVIFASDTSVAAQVRCRNAAIVNGVADRIKVVGHLRAEDLELILGRFKRAFVICDCEGSEKTLLDPAKVPSLARSDILVECHDFLDPEITSVLKSRLAPTHVIELLREGGRNPNSAHLLESQESLLRWLGICEFRPVPMHWLHCVAISRQPAVQSAD